MGLFNKLFSGGKKPTYQFAEEPQIFFGRYTGRNKTKLQYEYWEKSLQLYKAKKYLDAFEYFFYYLQDESIKNVAFRKESNRINFEFIQGSKIVKGSVNDEEVFAEAEVVRFDDISIPVMRELLRENNHLYYSKFVIKNNIYSLKYFSPVEDASPASFYNALKELATEADLFDDVLIDEFEHLHPINMEHIKEIPIEEKQLKLKYFKIWVKQILQRIYAFDAEQNEKEISFILQILLFKIYYLLAPQGVLLSDISYFQKTLLTNDVSVNELNKNIIESLKNVEKKTDSELMKSLYRVDATFAVNRPTSSNIVKNFISDELNKVNNYVSENKDELAFAHCEYILSYASFTFGMPSVVNDLLQVLWRIFYTSYFKELGFVDEYYAEETQMFNSELTTAKIETIINDAKKQHPKIKFKTEKLNFSDKLKFAISFFNEFQNVNYD